MGKTRPNPYRGARYARIFSNFRKKGAGIRFVNRETLIADEVAASGCSESAAKAAVGVILSPTESSERGDCRGNQSAMGHLYFAARKPAKSEGKGRKMLYSLRWREDELEPLRRDKKAKAETPETPEVEAKTEDAPEAEASEPAEA